MREKLATLSSPSNEPTTMAEGDIIQVAREQSRFTAWLDGRARNTGYPTCMVFRGTLHPNIPNLPIRIFEESNLFMPRNNFLNFNGKR